jgi:hypothetical protein
MAPVNSAPSSDMDNEATAELPVLDVAAYELAAKSGEHVAHSDTWVLPAGAFVPREIPTLTRAVPAYDLDFTGTHEMPPLQLDSPPAEAAVPPNKPAAKTRARRRAQPAITDLPDAAAAAPAPIVLPPSPPLIEELRGALADAERRIVELNERERIADAERSVAVARVNAECAELRQQLAEHLEALATSREQLRVQRTDQSELADALVARDDRIASLDKQLAEQGEALRQLRAQLAADGQRRETLECDAINLRATVARRNEHIAMLEADLAARAQRTASLDSQLREALAAIDPNAPRLQAEIADRDEKLRELKAELELARTQVREKDEDLQVAEESIRQLETELGDKNSKLAEASVTVEEWRAVIAESQRSILQRDSRIQQLEADIEKRAAGAVKAADLTGEEIALEGPARVFIRTDGNTDFVHVLGRRTRIGRGGDNEIVLDTKHVSRYHAVLLAGPVNTSIEDLNSTNGVFVNGKRVTRQVLNNGDRVTIGRSQFRYTVRD